MIILVAHTCHRLGVFFIVLARRQVRFVDNAMVDERFDWFVNGLPALHRKVALELKAQRRTYSRYAYFWGYPYQALGILGIFGERGTEERFEAYGLRELIGPQDLILDIGCNCGFLALYTAFRTGCTVEGIDINPHMIKIGHYCASYLGIQEQVRLQVGEFQDFRPSQRYTMVFSLATHWTDDGGYRVSLRDHLIRIHDLLDDGGLLVFESHSVDVGNAEFYETLEGMKPQFNQLSKKALGRESREVFIFKKGSPTSPATSGDD